MDEGEFRVRAGFAFVFSTLSFIIFFMTGGRREMRRRRLFLTILPIVIIMLFGRVPPSFSKDLFRQFTTDDGLKVILHENRAAPVIALQIWVRIGSADENDEEAGMCHFIEHMLFKGTGKRGVREAAKEVESLGGTINAYTSYDQTVYHITLASRYAEIGLDLLSDALQHSVFDPVEFEREREVILEEIRRQQDDPSRRLFQQTAATLFTSHPYKRPVIGFERTVRSIQRDQMVAFFKRWYTANQMVLIAVGDFNTDEMEGKVKNAFREFKPSPDNLPLRATEPEQRETRSVLSSGHFKETYLQMAFPISSARDEETPVLDALSRLLGGGESSRLVQKIKLEKGLVHSMYASAYTPKDPGLFIIGATLPAENVENAVRAIWEEVMHLRADGPIPEELHRVKVNIESDLVYGRQTVQGQAGKIGFYEVNAGDVQSEEAYMRSIALLEGRDIQRVLKKYINKDRLTLSILAPDEKIDLLKNLSLKSILKEGGEGEASVDKKPLVSKTVLENGVRLIIRENRSLPIVSVQVSFLGGVRFEEESQSGISQFMSVMMTKGTKSQSSLEIAKKIERMAGSLNSFSGNNSFGITFTFLNQHFEEALHLLAEVIRHPSFKEEEMEKRRRLIVAALRQQEDDLQRLVFNQFRKTLFKKHPYRMDPLGTVDSVQRITQNDLKEYYQRLLAPENMVVTVVGDVDEKEVLQAIQKGFGDLKKGSFSAPAVPQEPRLDKTRRTEINKSKEQAHFVLGFLGTSFHNKDRFALEVLGAALSGQGGRLFFELRDKESLAYALTFVNQTNYDPGYIGVYMGTHPKKLERAIEAVLRELKKVKAGGLTEEEVDRAKKYLVGNFEIGLQTNGAQANQMSLDELYGLGFDHFQKFPQEIQKVTKDEVNRVAKEYFNLDAYALALIRPTSDKQE